MSRTKAASPSAVTHSTPALNLTPAWLRQLRQALRRWYAKHARDLPWRRTTNPYPIWISEIMLQQTTVVAVIPYFERFLNRFPTLEALAAAEEEDILRFWEGLGYYSRARNIHKTARLLVTEQAGRFPDDLARLIALPGIGRYTAGAIASFAYDRRAPILEANTLRLYSRLLGFRGDPRARDGQNLLWEFAEQILPRQAAGLFNQAVMELGATLCSPAEPRCEACPVQTCCAAFAAGLQREIPQAPQRPEPTAVTELTVAIQRQGTFLLYRRQPGERWAGLWDFPRYAWEAQTSAHANGGPWLEEILQSQLGIKAAVGKLVTEMRHSVTRFRITLLCFVAEYIAGKVPSAPGEYRWVAPEQFSDYPLSVTGRKFARLLATSNGTGRAKELRTK